MLLWFLVNIIGRIIENINSNFKNKQKADATSEDNIYIDCRITAEEAKCGCSKIIKYSRINKDNKKVKNVITVNIPKGIQDGQNIVLCNEGNYLENEKYSNLVISIKIKWKERVPLTLSFNILLITDKTKFKTFLNNSYKSYSTIIKSEILHSNILQSLSILSYFIDFVFISTIALKLL